MKKDIYTNIKDKDALESFIECITFCSINTEGVGYNSLLHKTSQTPKCSLSFEIFISQ
tara:strand:+ start:200 stop:373 length:174 start_codon:yes stop_codon:yes gene_type:complete